MLLVVAPELKPPVAERRPVTLTAHGDDRVDDWYWLRDRDDPALGELLEAEAAYLKVATEGNEPLTESVYSEILARVKLTDVTLPSPKGPWAYYSRTVEGLEHPIHCRRPADSPPPPSEPGPRPTAPGTTPPGATPGATPPGATAPGATPTGATPPSTAATAPADEFEEIILDVNVLAE